MSQDSKNKIELKQIQCAMQTKKKVSMKLKLPQLSKTFIYMRIFLIWFKLREEIIAGI